MIMEGSKPQIKPETAQDRDRTLLKIENLWVEFHTVEGVHQAVRGSTWEIAAGESLGIVGESGSGKSVTALSIMGLIPNPPGKITEGRILFEGRDLLRLEPHELNDIRGNEISMVFQEPMTSLNPIHSCGKQVMETLILHKGDTKDTASARALELLDMVGIPMPEQRLKAYPHQLSGGMRQRVMIAIALACQPKLLIADEPTTALDVTIQAQILELMKDLRREINTSILMITHNIGIIAELCSRVIVMYAGQVVEISPVRELLRLPMHPYSEGLINSMPTINRGKKQLFSIEGTVPSPFNMPPGCSFAPRCKYAKDICYQECPSLTDLGNRRTTRCWYYGEMNKGI
jgi:oligopeptide/dipeptide ABC transporter ATP-binding protein